MDAKIKKAVERYQCCGCRYGSSIRCYEKFNEGVGCGKHFPGTMIIPGGKVFLGMPKGFNRLNDNLRLHVFENYEQGWVYDKWNIPVWKYLTSDGHTIVRGLSPRNNFPFLHVFLEDCMSKVTCLEISQEDVDYMD